MWKKIFAASILSLSLMMGANRVQAAEWANGTGECHDDGWDSSSITCADGQAVKGPENNGTIEYQYCRVDATNKGSNDGKCRDKESDGQEGDRCYYCPYSVTQANNIEETGSFNVCENLSSIDAVASGKCDQCWANGGYWSAIGCVPIHSVDLVAYLVRIAMGLAGILLTAQIVIGSVQIIFASGDSTALNAAKKRVVNSLIAIGFMIFGVAILQIIGVQILHIPGFFGI